MSLLIWIQTVWHSDCIPEIIFPKIDFERKSRRQKSMIILKLLKYKHYLKWECSGSVVECLTRDLGAVGSSLTHVTALCPWARPLSKLSTGSTQEDPSLHNWKIVDGMLRIKSNKTYLKCYENYNIFFILVWCARETRGETVPVHRLARPRGTRPSDAIVNVYETC